MKLWTDSFEDGGVIPSRFAFGKHDADTHVTLCENESPHLAWSELPEGTRSLALLMHDSDVPSQGDDVNQEGKTVPAELPRVDFFHWVLVDLSPEACTLSPGDFSTGVTARGKTVKDSPLGRPGLNDYTGWFSGDDEMKGEYFGYDGPCPPWNDSIVHHYHFTLFALDLATLPVEGAFTGAAVRAAMEGHVLAEASVGGTYTVNPDAR